MCPDEESLELGNIMQHSHGQTHALGEHDPNIQRLLRRRSATHRQENTPAFDPTFQPRKHDIAGRILQYRVCDAPINDGAWLSCKPFQ